MIRQGHVERAQIILILWYALSAKLFLTFPSSLIGETLSASWWVMAGAGVIALVAFLPGLALMRRFVRLPLARAFDEAGGLILGKAASFAVGATLLAITALSLREFGESFTVSILPQTPVTIIMVTFALLAGYAAYVGLESLGRVAIFMTPFLLILFGLILFSNPEDFNPLRLFPLLGPGLGTVASSTFLRSSVYAELLLLLIAYPYLRERRDAVPVAVWAMVLAAGVLMITQVIITGVFDNFGTVRFPFPVLRLARLATLSRFITRIDPVFVFLWFFVAATKQTIMLWAASTHLAETLRLPTNRPLIPALTVIVIALGLAPRSIEQVAEISFMGVFRWAWLTAFALPAVFWLLAVIRKKTGQNAPAEAKGGGR